MAKRKRKYRPRVDKRHLEAARLFLGGPPGQRGKWRAACKAAGFSRVSRKDSIAMKTALDRMRSDGEDVDDTQRELVDLLESDGASWEEMAPVARAMLAKIGAGAAQASSGQVAALKEIVARNEGRVGTEPQRDRPIGIVVLPALGSLREAIVDAPPLGEPILAERHNRDARREARSAEWKKARSIPGGGYRDEEHGGRA